MSRLEQLIGIIGVLEEKFYVDLLDMRLMAEATKRWNEGRTVRVSDLTLLRDIASSATLHYRVTKSMVDDHIFMLRPNPEDMREKIVEPGSRYKQLMNFLETLG
jgi:hypothetical protein